MVDWVKVLDFGIAKVAVGEQSMQTVAGLVFGTARYISPEGAQGARELAAPLRPRDRAFVGSHRKAQRLRDRGARVLLGAALAVIGTQLLASRAGNDRAAHLARARRALTESRYVNPPGDNVSDIVTAGLAKSGTAIPIAASDTHDFKGTMVAPSVGSYDVVFETVVDGTTVRASRDLDVVR
jgi:hypothetical protein